MPSCATCGGTDDVRLYERRDDPDVPRWWWCVDCAYYAGRLTNIAADPVPRWVERAALNGLPARPVDERRERRVGFGRRATDKAVPLTGID